MGSSAPTRRCCVILGCPAPCPSCGASPPTPRHTRSTTQSDLRHALSPLRPPEYVPRVLPRGRSLGETQARTSLTPAGRRLIRRLARLRWSPRPHASAPRLPLSRGVLRATGSTSTRVDGGKVIDQAKSWKHERPTARRCERAPTPAPHLAPRACACRLARAASPPPEHRCGDSRPAAAQGAPSASSPSGSRASGEVPTGRSRVSAA